MSFLSRERIPENETTVARQENLFDACNRKFVDVIVSDDDNRNSAGITFYFSFGFSGIDFLVGYNCRTNKCWVVKGEADRATRTIAYKRVRSIANGAKQ